MSGCLRSLSLLTAAIPAGELPMAVFFLYLMVLKLLGSGSTVGPEDEVPAAAETSLYYNSGKVVLTGIETTAETWVGGAAKGTH
jgi:hypothetical protein